MCIVAGCDKTLKDNVSFHFLPEKWKTAENMDGKGEAYASKVARPNSVQYNM